MWITYNSPFSGLEWQFYLSRWRYPYAWGRNTETLTVGCDKTNLSGINFVLSQCISFSYLYYRITLSAPCCHVIASLLSRYVHTVISFPHSPPEVSITTGDQLTRMRRYTVKPQSQFCLFMGCAFVARQNNYAALIRS